MPDYLEHLVVELDGIEGDHKAQDPLECKARDVHPGDEDVHRSRRVDEDIGNPAV